MHLQYRLTFKDFLSAQALHAKRDVFPYIWYLTPRYIFPLGGACALLWALSSHRPFSSKVADILFALYFLLSPVFVHFLYKRQFRRTRTTEEESSIDLEDDMIRCQGTHSKGELLWAAVRSFSEDSKMLLLYLAPGKFLCIPKRACTESQLEELRGLLQVKINPALPG